MGILSRLFGGAKASKPATKEVEHKGYVIVAKPHKAAGGWQLAGEISKDGRVHKFVRADQFNTVEEAIEYAVIKGMLIIEQLGEAMFG